ncbi:MAG: O-acetyl-ADP-ribose deacetylase [Acidimicrobiales bacterium]
MAELSVHRGDITEMAVGAIVNAANSSLQGGGGVDGAIHRAGGPSILADCRAIVEAHGPCRPGQAVVTGAGELPAGIVIHTVGPIWSEDRAAEHDETLASCYRESLFMAAKHNVRDIAFPNISTGVYGFPKPRAARVAVNATLDWLEQQTDHSLDRIIFVCFDDENHELYRVLIERSSVRPRRRR